MLISSEMESVCNFPYDNTFLGVFINLEFLIKRLAHDAQLALVWFKSNYLKLTEVSFFPTTSSKT